MNAITVSVRHMTIPIERPFVEACQRFESRLGKLDYSEFQRHLNLKEPEAARAFIRKVEGPLGLMVFGVIDHGSLLSLAEKETEARQYVVGNPLIALQMTSHDIRAGLYAPLRVFIGEVGKSQSVIEYDLPSTLFGQFRNEKVNEVARQLDEKLAAAVDYVIA